MDDNKPTPGFVAGEKIGAGDPVYVGQDGRIYRQLTPEQRRWENLLETARELVKGGEVEPDVILLPTDVPGVLIEFDAKDEEESDG